MEKTSRKKLLNFSHMLMGCRFDVWLRLLIDNRFAVAPQDIPQAVLITLFTLVLFPFALLERLLLAIPLRRQQVKQPLFVLGHWRSGTTYLQNLLSRDPQFGYFDPVGTLTCHNSWLLRPILKLVEKSALVGARPMDNLEYRMDLPMEEMLAVNASCQVCIAHMLSFVNHYDFYVDQAFLEDLPERRRKRWERVYTYLLKKQTFLCHGKPLMLKSPDATCHAATLLRLYPDARFVNIYRDPYRVIPSTINMFNKLFDVHALQKPPTQELVENVVIGLFKRSYETLFADMEKISPAQLVEVKYEEFEQTPMAHLEQIYAHLGVPGFEQARPVLQAYVDSQKDYRKNQFHIRPALVEKINKELGFYFEHYGYEQISTAQAEA